MNNKVKAIAQNLATQITILTALVAVLWIIEGIDWLLPMWDLNDYGIIPRTEIGLRGIFLAPFLHGNFAHLAANTAPFIVFGWLILLAGVGDFLFVSGVAMLVSGTGTWLIGSSGSHIGASGVIFGYFGFLLLRGLFERSPMSIILSLIVGLVYGGFIWGVLPNQPGISWEGHLFGFLGGVLAAQILGNRRRKSQP